MTPRLKEIYSNEIQPALKDRCCPRKSVTRRKIRLYKEQTER